MSEDFETLTIKDEKKLDFEVKINNFTDLEIAWTYIICYLTESLEGFDEEVGITEKEVKEIIRKCKKESKDFKLSYEYWKTFTELAQSEKTLISALIVRSNGMAIDYERFYKFTDDPLDYLEFMQFGYRLDYDKLFEYAKK